ncbi:MAG TPA: group III truncated hemoglobin [Flavisolibacter sp.]|jgi:hemoglobin|nr:group III truncated hemoglobin [Flavisolibacter sp.]
MVDKRDIETRADLELVLARFYDRALTDDEIGTFFTEVVPLHLPTHLPLILDFWESVVLGTRGYSKDVMSIHRNIHNLATISTAHLDRWYYLFSTTVAEHFSGKNATLMMQRARSIATMMDIKLNHDKR